MKDENLSLRDKNIVKNGLMSLCGCGCGARVRSPSYRFRRGHQNRMRSIQDKKKKNLY